MKDCIWSERLRMRFHAGSNPIIYGKPSDIRMIDSDGTMLVSGTFLDEADPIDESWSAEAISANRANQMKSEVKEL